MAAWGEVTERSFSRMVVKPDWDIPPAVGVDGPDVENASMAPGEFGQGGLDEEERCANIDGVGPVPHLEGHLRRLRAGHHPGIVDQSVEPAELGYRKFDELGGGGRIGEITEVNRSASELFRGFPGEVFFQSMDDHPGALFMATPGNRFADPSGGAGDQDAFVFESHVEEEVRGEGRGGFGTANERELIPELATRAVESLGNQVAPWTWSQISFNDASRSPAAVLKESASMVRGAPSTTSGAP